MYAWKYWQHAVRSSSVQTDELRPRWISLLGPLKRLKVDLVNDGAVSENQDHYRMDWPWWTVSCYSG
ncbi:hypothetical protein HBI56_210330 [Parastagonospora nodorum]|uniref:Uncharacterized protein n=1 Tax=Phaeosphaeria nodorum (strain SN15 / ATCC MYA-4574 / FGSC 10173) TaxID=321614 RepID=A0A7U2F7D0_PHANO|nr:hypothetical protein HBH56_213990 [Parastagonospora nodorum]QRC97819.1 hypothetical protein JI435_411060 [Parastagonospora nodorum SN15]KAH3923127.1 hypothetical protein HBH54_215660 [Parastagonospora nodorum]KAH3941772.1 hypothetical protein HBH53_196450 [Parastagonospora nodorum]KAH3961006.1 hypothetical protein HBH51_186280 [Parastagonospora nodorum]